MAYKKLLLRIRIVLIKRIEFQDPCEQRKASDDDAGEKIIGSRQFRAMMRLAEINQEGKEKKLSSTSPPGKDFSNSFIFFVHDHC